jgi:hypothetical protein
MDALPLTALQKRSDQTNTDQAPTATLLGGAVLQQWHHNPLDLLPTDTHHTAAHPAVLLGEGGGGDGEGGDPEDPEEPEGLGEPLGVPDGLAASVMGVKPAVAGVGGPGGVVQLPAWKKYWDGQPLQKESPCLLIHSDAYWKGF